MEMQINGASPIHPVKLESTVNGGQEHQPCSICSGNVVMDSIGRALFCDDCWDHKCAAMQTD